MTDSAKYDPDSTVTAELNEFAKDISGFAYNATEEQKKALLQLLKNENILNLLENWRHTDLRKAPRKPCSLTTYYAVGDQLLTGTVKNVSQGGVFIETPEPLSVGQEITMSFWVANQEEPIEIMGIVIWTDSRGGGVRFASSPTEELLELIESL